MICFEECSNLRITREVGMPDVVWLHLTWEFARGFKYQPVIKHFDLYFRSLDVIGSVAASVDRHLLNDELWVITLCHKLSMLSQECMLANLSLDKLNRLLDLVQNGSLKDDVLDDVHLCANFLVNTFIADETGTTAREEVLRVLAEKQNAGYANILFTLLVSFDKTVILS